MGMNTLAQVLKETKFGVALGPKYCMSWESGCLGHANAPRGFPKYEATKRFGHVGMRGTVRLGASFPRGMMVDKCMGSFG
jgi:hypothetical protein